MDLLIDFLYDAKSNSTIPFQGEKSIFVYIGNEAGDLDSFVASIVYAYYSSLVAGDDALRVAVMPIPRDDFNFRTETTYFFKRCGLDERALIFCDEVHHVIENAFVNHKLKIVLLDHNVPSGFIKKYSNCVVEILDHHVDEKRYENLGKKKK